jgi:hypothetical protein
MMETWLASAQAMTCWRWTQRLVRNSSLLRLRVLAVCQQLVSTRTKGPLHDPEMHAWDNQQASGADPEQNAASVYPSCLTVRDVHRDLAQLCECDACVRLELVMSSTKLLHPAERLFWCRSRRARASVLQLYLPMQSELVWFRAPSARCRPAGQALLDIVSNGIKNV